MRRMLRAPVFAMTLALMLAGMAALALLPKRTVSDLENRPLAEWAPGAWMRSEQPAERFETYVSDHFPLRDALVRVQATLSVLSGDRLQDGVLVGRAGVLIEEPQAEVTRTALASLEVLGEVQRALGVSMTLLLIPTSAQARRDALPTLYEPGDQMGVIRELYAQAGSLRPLDAELTGEGLYYGTDHHLTADGARILYERLAKAWGFDPRESVRLRAEGFLGSYYARVPTLLTQPEVMTAELPDGLRLTLDGEARASLLDEAALSGRNKYAAILAQTYAHAVIEGGEGEERLLVIGDSYANALVPSLARHFARVDVIDPRYFAGNLLETARAAGSTRALAVFGLNTFSTNRALMMLDVGEEE